MWPCPGARRFGVLEDHPLTSSVEGEPGIIHIWKPPDSPPERYENTWHNDATWRECPPMGAVLRCIECPPVGGDTMWANMELANERLPAHVKDMIADLRARHSMEATFMAAKPSEERLAMKARNTRCAGAGNGTAWRSGITAAPSTTR